MHFKYTQVFVLFAIINSEKVYCSCITEVFEFPEFYISFVLFTVFLFAYSFVGIFGISPVGQLKQTNNFSECLPSHQSNFSVIRSLLVATHINKQRCLELWMGWIRLHIVNCFNALAFLHSFLPPLQFWHLFPTVLILHFLCSFTLFPWLCFTSLKTFALDFATCLTGEKPSAGTVRDVCKTLIYASFLDKPQICGLALDTN